MTFIEEKELMEIDGGWCVRCNSFSVCIGSNRKSSSSSSSSSGGC